MNEIEFTYPVVVPIEETAPVALPPLEIDDEPFRAARKVHAAARRREAGWQDLRNDPFVHFVRTVAGNIERAPLESMYRSAARVEVLVRPRESETTRVIDFVKDDVDFQFALGALEPEQRRLAEGWLESVRNERAHVLYFLSTASEEQANAVGATIQELRSEVTLNEAADRVLSDPRAMELVRARPRNPAGMEVEFGTPEEQMNAHADAAESAFVLQKFRAVAPELEEAWRDAKRRFVVRRMAEPGVEDVDWRTIEFERDYCALLEPRIVAATRTAYDYLKSFKRDLPPLDVVITDPKDHARFSVMTKLTAALIQFSTNPTTSTAFTVAKRMITQADLERHKAAVRVWAGWRPAPAPRRPRYALFG